MRFWIPWGIAFIVTTIFLFFFVAGLADRTVSSFNMGLWIVTVVCVTGVTGGSLLLKKAGRPGLATLLTLVLAVPGLLAALFFLFLILSNPRWN